MPKDRKPTNPRATIESLSTLHTLFETQYTEMATADLSTRRLDVHEKNAWMLRSHLE
jgi:DNA-binding ferritin-like protein